MWEEIGLSVLKDVIVAVATAAALAVLRRFLPFLPGKVRESAEETEPKSFGQDFGLYVFRVFLIFMTIVVTLLVSLRAEGTPVNLNQARVIGRYLPSLEFTRNSFAPHFRLTLLALVPFVIAERAACLFIWWLGAASGYTSKEFRNGALGFVILGLCFVLSAHLVFFFKTVDYATAWEKAGKGWAIFFAMAVVTAGLKKKKDPATA